MSSFAVVFDYPCWLMVPGTGASERPGVPDGDGTVWSAPVKTSDAVKRFYAPPQLLGLSRQLNCCHSNIAILCPQDGGCRHTVLLGQILCIRP